MEMTPQKPSQSDCCGSGCSPCVFEVYDKLLETLGNKKTDVGQQSVTGDRHDLLSPLKYSPFVLLDIVKVNVSCRLYTFQPSVFIDGNIEEFGLKENPDLNNPIDGVLPYNPGQHIIMRNFKTQTENVGVFSSTVSRCYTPVSVARQEENCLMKLLIKLYDGKKMSSFIAGLEIGDVVFLRGPFGDFRHVKNSKYLMICAGTGFAPMYPIIKEILSDEEDETLIRLCFASASLDDIFFREDLRKFSKFWNFQAHIFLSTESIVKLQREMKHGEDIRRQKITFDVVREECFQNDFTVLICGSESFNADMRNYVERCGNKNIFVF